LIHNFVSVDLDPKSMRFIEYPRPFSRSRAGRVGFGEFPGEFEGTLIYLILGSDSAPKKNPVATEKVG
jgi:hypothetical protein